jgi:hypothetical protein
MTTGRSRCGTIGSCRSPQFVDLRLGYLGMQFAILGAILMGLEFLVDGTVGGLAGRIGAWLRRRRSARRRVDLATGGVFIGPGVRLPSNNDAGPLSPGQGRQVAGVAAGRS